MGNNKYKRDYLPDVRRLVKELEDAIIEKNDLKEIIVRNELEEVLRKIKDAGYVEEE